MDNHFSNEAGVALAEAFLPVNKTLRMIDLSKATNVVARAYEAFSAMLWFNTDIVLGIPPFKTGGADEILREPRKQMIIEQRLNQVGRGKLLSPC
jgi:hypothetical protein